MNLLGMLIGALIGLLISLVLIFVLHELGFNNVIFTGIIGFILGYAGCEIGKIYIKIGRKL